MFETTLDRRALAEVYTILRALEESTLKKIPSNIVDAIRYNMDFKYEVDYSKLLNNELLDDTKKILSVLYIDYLASYEERDVIYKMENLKYANNDNIFFDSKNKNVSKSNILNEELKDHVGLGFSSIEELEEWAHDHLLDKVVYMTMNHKFFFVSHKGELLTQKDFIDYYKSLLFYAEKRGAKTIEVPWVPEGYTFYDKAYIAAEQSDGVHRPLYYRDYTVPSGYYNEERDAFNVAKPFPVFAKETGKDTSHIYTYIQYLTQQGHIVDVFIPETANEEYLPLESVANSVVKYDVKPSFFREKIYSIFKVLFYIEALNNSILPFLTR